MPEQRLTRTRRAYMTPAEKAEYYGLGVGDFDPPAPKPLPPGWEFTLDAVDPPDESEVEP